MCIPPVLSERTSFCVWIQKRLWYLCLPWQVFFVALSLLHITTHVFCTKNTPSSKLQTLPQQNIMDWNNFNWSFMNLSLLSIYYLYFCLLLQRKLLLFEEHHSFKARGVISRFTFHSLRFFTWHHQHVINLCPEITKIIGHLHAG